MRFRLAPISVTLDDPERPKRPARRNNKNSGAPIKISTKMDLRYRLQNVDLGRSF